MQEHSTKKVELLRHYLNAYLAVIGHDIYTNAIHCYDLFCGEGIYPNGGKGSPIVFIECLRACAAQCPGKRFTFHFNDQDSDKVASVQRCIELLGQMPRNLVITSSTSPFDIVIQQTTRKLTEMGREKAFLFIDPYGYKEINPHLIKDLMKEGKSEALLFLPTQQMFRFSNKGTPEALSEFLEGIHRGRTFPIGANMADYLAYIVKGFRLLLPDFIVDSFTIRKDPQTAFCLFFFTSNLKGAEKMLEAKWKLDEQQGLGWSYEASYSAGNLFSKPLINPLENLLEARLHSGQQTNGTIYEFTIRAGFLPAHALQILEAMQKDGRIHVKPEGVRKGAFYLNYQATHGSDSSKLKSITIHLT